jgi:uncharacterized RDD family membrane protein YckC
MTEMGSETNFRPNRQGYARREAGSGKSTLTPVAPAWAEKSERWRSFVTPEGVDLRLRLGDAGERASAFFLDIAIIVAMLVVLTIIVLLAAMAAGRRGMEFMATIWLLGFFFLRNFYFMAFELSPRAATPGKRVLGLRVATRSGGVLSPTAIFARNAMRELEFFLPLGFLATAGGWVGLASLVWSGIFALFPLFNRDRLRVGDFVAGTWVVRAPRVALDIDLAARGEQQSGRFSFSDAEVNAYGIKELAVLEQVLRRRDDDTMLAVATRIRTKLGRARVPGETNEAFLQAYYLALRKRLEARLLFGHRRKDKFDK